MPDENKLDANEYRHFCRMLAAVLDRARKAEMLAFDLDQANQLITSLMEENDRLKKNKT
jgi:hypothetical protein